VAASGEAKRQAAPARGFCFRPTSPRWCLFSRTRGTKARAVALCSPRRPFQLSPAPLERGRAFSGQASTKPSGKHAGADRSGRDGYGRPDACAACAGSGRDTAPALERHRPGARNQLWREAPFQTQWLRPQPCRPALRRLCLQPEPANPSRKNVVPRASLLSLRAGNRKRDRRSVTTAGPALPRRRHFSCPCHRLQGTHRPVGR
jgi:hypothetical protein